MNTPDWWEDPDLAIAVAEVEEFAAAAGWDAPPQLFALVVTSELLAAQPALAPTLTETTRFTPIAQESLPEGELSQALSQISWPPEAGASLSADPETAADEAAGHPDRAEARLAAGVLRDAQGGACLLRLRGEHDDAPLRGADLAPNLLKALRRTFED